MRRRLAWTLRKDEPHKPRVKTKPYINPKPQNRAKPGNSGVLLQQNECPHGIRLHAHALQCDFLQISAFQRSSEVDVCCSPFLALGEARRLRRGALAWYGAPCSTWIFMRLGHALWCFPLRARAVTLRVLPVRKEPWIYKTQTIQHQRLVETFASVA